MNDARDTRRRIASVALLRALMPSTRPCLFRSSGTRPRPARIASVGEASGTACPSTVTRPLTRASRPNSACAISDRPAPTRPAKPSTSPRRSVNEMSRKPAGLDSPSTRSASRPVAPHGDRVAQLEDLLHAVADIDARDTLLAQPADQPVERVRLVLRQAAGRLVEHDDPGTAPDRRGNLQHLLL